MIVDAPCSKSMNNRFVPTASRGAASELLAGRFFAAESLFAWLIHDAAKSSIPRTSITDSLLTCFKGNVVADRGTAWDSRTAYLNAFVRFVSIRNGWVEQVWASHLFYSTTR